MELHPYDERLTLENCIVFVFADSSFANGENMKSQCGFLVGLTTPKLKDGNDAPILIPETYSGSVKRVCRSTLAAETNGFLGGVDAGDYLRPKEKIFNLDFHYVKNKMLCLTGAKSLESTLNRDAGQPTDKRVRILVAQRVDR